jgi:hypothetical protein
VTQPAKLHIIRQEATALLGPIRDELVQLENRTIGFVERLDLSPADEARLRRAQRALATARAEIERLWQDEERAAR